MINIEKIFDNHSNRIYLAEEEYYAYVMNIEDFQNALKEIIPLVLQEAADSAEATYFFNNFNESTRENVVIDKQSILDTINKIKFD